MNGFFSKSFNPVRDLPELVGKVIIVTGGNAGIGYATVKHLARRGAKVYLAARNESKATHAIASLEAEGLGPGNGKVVWTKLDLSDPREAKKAAEDFLSKENRLDVLVNNAAMLICDAAKTRDGILDSMMINHISPFVFTNTLLPLMKKTAKIPNADVRIVTVSSEGHRKVPSKMKFSTMEDVNNSFDSSFIPAFMRYCNSKLANVLFVKELQRRLTADGIPITVIALHPGTVHTSFTQTMAFPRLANFVFSMLFKHPDEGAFTSVIAAASSDIRENPEYYKGAYLEPVGKIAEPSKLASDPELAVELWKTTEMILKDIGI